MLLLERRVYEKPSPFLLAKTVDGGENKKASVKRTNNLFRRSWVQNPRRVHENPSRFSVFANENNKFIRFEQLSLSAFPL